MKAVHFALVEIRNAATSVNAQKNVVEAVVRVNKLHDNVQKLANEIKVKSELVEMYKQAAHNIALYTTAASKTLLSEASAAAEETANEMLKTLEKIVDSESSTDEDINNAGMVYANARQDANKANEAFKASTKATDHIIATNNEVDAIDNANRILSKLPETPWNSLWYTNSPTWTKSVKI